jgi:hypothetical protein
MNDHPIGTAIFRRLPELVMPEHREVTIREWSPTPFMEDVMSTDREDEMIRWCQQQFGPESSPMHKRNGRWRRSLVTIHGWCWFGFETEELMNRFVERFPSPPYPK